MPGAFNPNLLSAASSTASGAATGSMVLPGIGTGVGALVGLLSGIFGSQESSQEEASQKAYEMIQKYLPELSKQSYTKDEINAIVKQMQIAYRGAGSISAGQVGAAIGESGVAKGGGYADYYTQAVAPILAEGQMKAADAEQFGVAAYNDSYNSAKNRLANALGMLTQSAQGLSTMTGGQKGIIGGLQGLNLGATAFGNLAKGYKDLTYKPIGG